MPDVVHIRFIGYEPGAKLGIHELFHTDLVSDVFELTDGVGNVDGEGVIGDVADNNDIS
jgi:hypothetical protein